MKISYSDLALIINSIRDNGHFDGVDDLYEFMDKLDEEEGYGISLSKYHGSTVWDIDVEVME